MKPLKLISPVDGSIYLERPAAAPAELADILGRAERAQPDWERVSLPQRIELIERGVRELELQTDEAAVELAWQMGRPLRYGAMEIATAAKRARHMLSLADASLVDQQVAPGRVISREPIGVVLIIAPWNYPYLTAINSIIPSLAAGNSIVLKHSFQTALVAERLRDAFVSAGIPPAVFQVLHCENELTLQAVRRREVGHIVFTGSVEVGRLVAAEAARSLKSVTLELGGKDAAYVRADADLDEAVNGLVEGAYFNSGQSCCGIERIYVDHLLLPEFIGRFAAEAANLVLGQPLELETTLGPMATARGADAVRAHIETAVAAGALPLLNYDRAEAPGGNYLHPEALTAVTHDMALMRDESFGPVVGIMSVESDGEAVALINDSRFGLTASVWSQDAAQVSALADQIMCGTIYQNRCDFLDPALPWSGRRDSGLGLSLSHLAYDSLTRTKSLLFTPVLAQTINRTEHAAFAHPAHVGDDQ